MSMRIGEAARLAGVNVQTLRYYERKRLLDSPQRAPSGYRNYSIEAVQRVRLVKWFQTLGFSLQDIREMLPGQIDTSSKAAIRARARGKIVELKKKISALESISRTLEEVSNCDCADECPIVAAAMAGTTPAATRSPSRVTHSRRRKQ